MTKLVMTLLVRDNADIVAANMDFHLAMGVDHIVVTNNRSEDATRDIVLNYVRRGVATLIDELDDDYDQSAWVTRMARLAARDLSADWIVNSDVDEFWWPVEGNLKTMFSAIPPAYGTLPAPRLNFLPMRTLSSVFWREMVWRHAVSRNALGEPLPGKVAHRAALDVVVAAGNHAAASVSLGPPEPGGSIVIFHFPYRSYLQYSGKIAKGGPAVANNRKAGADAFHTWRQHHKLQSEHGLEEWFRNLAHGDDPTIEELALKGEVVRDTRLRTFMENIGGGKERAT
jgi:hypothetical protein